MIILKNINRTYKPKRGVPVHALVDVNLTLPKTGMVFVLGKSGSGKSTLLNVVGGLDKYDSGELIVKDKSSLKFNQNDFDSYRNTMIGFIFQEYNLLDEFTVAENIGLALELQGKKVKPGIIERILKLVDLEGYSARRPNELSGGQKQRVAIARALVKRPEIIMADEPTGALDSDTGKQVLDTLKRLSRDRLVIVVSHDRDFAFNYADRIVEFVDGRIVSDITRTVTKASRAENFSLKDNELTIRRGYTLTSEDVNLINEYLKTGNKDLVLRGQARGASDFAPTNNARIQIETEQYKPIRSRLPFKSSLKIGASSLKSKPVRLVISIILASVAFGLFGLSDTMASYDKSAAVLHSLEDAEYPQLSVYKAQNKRYGSFVLERRYSMTNDDVNALNTLFPSGNFIGVYGNDYLSFTYMNLFKPIKNDDQMIYHDYVLGYIEMNAARLAKTNLSKIAGDYPQANNEIMITKHMSSYFEKHNYRNLTTMDEEVIRNYNDMLNKEIYLEGDTFKVVGIVDSHFDLAKFNIPTQLDEETKATISRDIYNEYTSSLHLAIFTNVGHEATIETATRVYTYSLDTSLTLVDSDGEYLGFEYIDHVKNAPSDMTVYFKNETTATGATGALMSFQSYVDYMAIVHNEYLMSDLQQLMIAELKDIPFATIESLLDDVGEEVNLSINDEDFYYSMFFDYYYSDFTYYEPPSSLPTRDEVMFNAGEQLLSNKTRLDLSLVNTDWFNETSTSESLHINGIVFDRDEYGSTLFLNNTYYNDLGIVEEGNYASAITFNTKDDAFIKKLAEMHFVEDTLTYRLNTPITNKLEEIGFLVDMLSNIFIYIGIGFAVFAGLMLLNFITISVSYKKKEIGILRAIGARGRDVTGIFTKEATIISLINFVLALIAVLVAVFFINYTFEKEMGMPLRILSFGIRQFALMLAISLFVGYASSAIPVAKTARKRPIDAIRDR